MNNIDVEIKDFIGIYSNVYPEGYCDHVIEEFDRLIELGCGTNRVTADGSLPHKKNDIAINASIKNMSLSPFDGIRPVDMFFNGLQRCYDHYTKEFSTLVDGNSIHADCAKMQKTVPGGGYHIWHHEQNSGPTAGRVMVYMLYLNTLGDDGAGETEFLYQQRRIKPTANTMILWPAAYTHVHRGNVVHGDKNKYVITGWFCFN